MSRIFMLLMFVGTFFSASSQILLKQSANIEHKSGIYEYLNWRVITAYFIFFGVLLLNTYAYTQVPYNTAPSSTLSLTCSYCFSPVSCWVRKSRRENLQETLLSLQES